MPRLAPRRKIELRNHARWRCLGQRETALLKRTTAPCCQKNAARRLCQKFGVNHELHTGIPRRFVLRRLTTSTLSPARGPARGTRGGEFDWFRVLALEVFICRLRCDSFSFNPVHDPHVLFTLHPASVRLRAASPSASARAMADKEGLPCTGVGPFCQDQHMVMPRRYELTVCGMKAVMVAASR